MAQTRGLNYVRINVLNVLAIRIRNELLGYSSPNLSDLNRVRQPIMKHVPLSRGYDLCHTGESAKRGGVQDAISVPLSGAAIVFSFILGKAFGAFRRGQSCWLRLPFPLTGNPAVFADVSGPH